MKSRAKCFACRATTRKKAVKQSDDIAVLFVRKSQNNARVNHFSPKSSTWAAIGRLFVLLDSFTQVQRPVGPRNLRSTTHRRALLQNVVSKNVVEQKYVVHILTQKRRRTPTRALATFGALIDLDE